MQFTSKLVLAGKAWAYQICINMFQVLGSLVRYSNNYGCEKF
jgi:hypothetical protein